MVAVTSDTMLLLLLCLRQGTYHCRCASAPSTPSFSTLAMKAGDVWVRWCHWRILAHTGAWCVPSNAKASTRPVSLSLWLQHGGRGKGFLFWDETNGSLHESSSSAEVAMTPQES